MTYTSSEVVHTFRNKTLTIFSGIFSLLLIALLVAAGSYLPARAQASTPEPTDAAAAYQAGGAAYTF